MISILLATTGRPDMAVRCVESIRGSTSGHDVEVVCAVDADPESAERLAPLVDLLLVSPHYRGCSQAWNDCLREAQGDPLVLAGDDLLFQLGWLDAALEAHADHPDFLIGFNDGHWDGNTGLSTHYLMSRKFIVEVLGGRVAWPYVHSFNDAEACGRARRAGRYYWAEEARVHHDHWLFGNRAKDATDTRNLGGHPESERLFKQREAEGFPDDLEAVITC